MSKLKAKQEKFVQGLITGLSQRQAYKQAYKSERMKDETIDNKASKLFKQHEIRARYDEIIEEYKQESIWTREKAVEALVWLMDKSKDDLEEEGFRQANSTAFLNAIKELNEIAVVYPMKAKQIEKIDSEIHKDETAEDKLSEYLKVLGDSIDGN